MKRPRFGFLSARTARLAMFDVLRLRARLLHRRRVTPPTPRLHLEAASFNDDRKRRMPGQALPEGMPSQHFVNWLFHQAGEHKNLFDFTLLQWALTQAGFHGCRRSNEAELLAHFPEFPVRNDDFQSLYVVAYCSPKAAG